MRPDRLPELEPGWLGSELAARPEAWTRHLTGVEIDDLFRLASDVAPDDLVGLDPLPIAARSTVELADEIRRRLLGPSGFVLVRGMPVESDRRRLAVAFFVLGALVGSPRSQNAAGHLLGHVRDVGLDVATGSTRIYQTNARQTFHTDSSDAVALLCLQRAEAGGESLLVDATTVYAILRERRPDLAARLFDPVATDRRDEIPAGALPWFEIPVLSWHADNLTVIYQRQYIDSAARFADAPRLDEEQVEALDLFDEIANDPAVHLSMVFEPGDVQFVHNHRLLHDRTAFVDHADPDRRRHLLRLWLSLPGDRALPAVFAQRYGSVAVGDRGGIRIGDAPLVVELDG